MTVIAQIELAPGLILQACEVQHEVYTFNNSATGESWRLDTTALREFMEENEWSRKESIFDIKKSDHDFALAQGGVEEEKVYRLLKAPVEVLIKPLIGVWYDPKIEGERQGIWLVDGNHRTVLFYRMGIPRTRIWWTGPFIWRRFLV